MSKKLKPLPKRSDEIIQEQIVPHLPHGKSVNENVFSENRGNDISLKGDKIKNISIGLKDIDEAIKFYFDNVIKPSVLQVGQRISVPVIYGNQELWKEIQSNGYYRDKNGKLLAPLISFKRDSVIKNRNIGNKLDGNKSNLLQSFQKTYSKLNSYDNFSALNNRNPVKEFIVTVVPDYVDVTYECVIFTDFMEQLNNLIEIINFASDSYWGDLKRFKFRASIDNFATITELNVGQDRVCKANFVLKLNGYLIPDSINKQLASVSRYYSKAQVIFGIETSTGDIDNITSNNFKTSKGGSVGFVDSLNTNVTVTSTPSGGSIDMSILTYLNTNIGITAVSNTSNTATFNATFLQPPVSSGLPATSLSNFTFYVNGQYIEHTAITSFVESSGTCILTINSSELGYLFTDLINPEIIAVGKFN